MLRYILRTQGAPSSQVLRIGNSLSKAEAAALAGNRIPHRHFFWKSKAEDEELSKKDTSQKKESKASGESSKENDGSANDTSSKGLPPSRMGHMDEAPRYPHLIGLPVIKRPIFPGIVNSVTLTDPKTIHALETYQTQNTRGGYLGVFLRKDGETEGGVVMETPEVITDPSCLYKVGTLAQIIRLQKNDIGSNLHVPSWHNKSPTSRLHGSMAGQSSQEGEDMEDEERASLLLLAHRRIDLVSVDNTGPPIDLTVSHWNKLQYNPDTSPTTDTIRALTNEILSTIREVAATNPFFREHLQIIFPSTRGNIDIQDPYRLADFVASVTSTGTPEDLQKILEERDAERRLHRSLVLISKEKEVSKLQAEISAKVEEKMSEQQRKYFLMEQLKSIKKELGMEYDDKDALIQKYQKKMSKKEVPKEVQTTFELELEKLSSLEKNSSEFNVTRSYLDWITDISWGFTTQENLDLEQARRVLDRDHYGLDDVKDIILQFIAVGKLKKGVAQGKILCLVGPPGVGKTSIASSIATALNRKFYRFSVGGLGDVSEIKGHRRTYIGAMPGKLIQCLKNVKSMNPLILIDEIDKLGRDGYRGDPASALLEVLDPSQNSTFVDHYLDLPVDLSKVLFMCTANEMDRIPGPLLDRMEIVRLSGYDVPEKIAIAEQYLVPKSMTESGLLIQQQDTTEEEEEEEQPPAKEDTPTENSLSEPIYIKPEEVPESLSIQRSAIENLVRWYCREAGVRNLSKHIDTITRKLALQIVAENEGTTLTEKTRRKSSWVVDKDNLSDYVGKPIFTSDRLYDKDPLPNGTVMGLAWTSMGGSALYIETQGLFQRRTGGSGGGGKLKVTGQLGDVMNESTQIAYTVARSRMSEMYPENTYYDDHDIHMHVPEGATPKDGPSAGITMVTAMLSLAMDKPVRNDLAMTGEISLNGKVLAVGGIKEKTMAARRAGIASIVYPKANQRDFEELPEYLKDGLEVFFADHYSQVYEVAFDA